MPRRTDDRLPDVADVLDAARQRLDAFPATTIDAAQRAVLRLLGRGIALDAAQPQVGAVLAMLRIAGDRRSPWGALLAVAVLIADARGDGGLLWRAGWPLLLAQRAASGGSARRRVDPLDELIREHLARHPETTAAALFEHFGSLARTGIVVDDFDGDTLTYFDGRRVRDVRHGAFAMRMSRIRRDAERLRGGESREPVAVIRAA